MMTRNPQRDDKVIFDTEAFLKRLIEEGKIPEDFARGFIDSLGPFDHVRVRNHWVPITYLSAFTDSGNNEGRVWMYDRADQSQAKHAGVAAVASEKYLYVEPNIDIPDIVERLLAKVEATFNPIRRKLIGGMQRGILSPLSGEERYSLALFLSLQQARTPFARKQAEQMEKFYTTFDLRVKLQNPREVQREYYEESGKRISRKAVRRWRRELDSGELFVEPAKGSWIGTFLKVAFQNAPLVAEIPLRVVKNRAAPFATTDMPVITTSRKAGSLEFGDGVGWMGENAEVLFPLTPSHILVMGQSCRDPIVGTREWCEHAWTAIIGHSHRFVFSKEKDGEIPKVLGRTPPPQNVLEYDGQQHSLDQPTGAVVKQVFEGKGELLRFGPRR